jgi:hypothetical protein
MIGDIPDGLIVTQGECLPDVEDRYVYPVIYGTEEWYSASMEEREELSQLSGDRIKTLSSYALIRSLLDKPRIWLDYLLSSSLSPVAICDRIIFSSHNSVPEFEKRGDRVQALISYYAVVSLNCYGQTDFDTQLKVLEVWFIRDAILHAMNDAQRKQAVALLLQKHKKKQSYNQATLVAMAWIMYEDRYPPIVEHYKTIKLTKEHYFEKKDNIISFAKKYCD